MNAPARHPRVVVAETADEAAGDVARLIAERLAAKPKSVLGLATGRSQHGVYSGLIERYRLGEISFAGVTSFNLDEYIGLPTSHLASFHYYMTERLFRHVDIPMHRAHLPDGLADNPEQAAKDYEVKICASGGIDLQLLGLGENGHIGFNEPGSPRASRTRVVALCETTRRANMRDFPPGESVPTHAMTMGVATILDAREIVLLATGKKKRDAVCHVMSSPPGSDNPASWLQTHGNATIICDRDAFPELC